MCKNCACINNQERRLHTVQGILHMHANAATLRDNDPTLAANTMLTMGQTTNLAAIANDSTSAQRPQSGAIEEAILRSTVNNGSSENSQGAAMLTIIDEP